MITFKRTSIFQWLIAALALVPLILYAYLGQFSRMIADDYCIAAVGQELGAWDGMLYWYRNWSGAYSNFFLKSAMAPLDTFLPRVTPTIIIVLWLVGLSWLVFQCLACLGIGKPRRALSISIASLTVAATIHAFYSPQSFYWFSASIPYTLTLAWFTIYMALSLLGARRGKENTLSLLGIIVGAALCFISTGMAEMFVVFQTTFLTLCLLAIFAFLRSSVRRSYALVFGVGGLATLGGLAIQLSSPGVALRAAYIVQTYGQPNRSISTMISETLTRTLGYIGHPQALVGFIMLMGVGLLVMLIQYRPQAALKTLKSVKLALPPLRIGLVVQLIFIPILWQHTSDQPQLLERFSIRYMTVIILNIIFILSFLALLWRRKTINAKLQQLEHGLLIGWHTVGFTLAVVLFAFMRMRIEDIHYRASIYLITSFLVFLGIIIWQLLSVNQTPSTRSFGFLALYVYATGAVCIAAIVGMVLFGRGGFVAARTLAPGAYLLVLPGLIWGAYLGYLIKNHPPRSQAGQAWIRLFKLISLAIVLIIGMGIVLGQAALAPDFQLYAKEWDARHQEIITMRDSGQTAIEIAPLTFDLTKYVGISSTWAQFPTNSCSKRYYGVDSIIVPGD